MKQSVHNTQGTRGLLRARAALLMGTGVVLCSSFLMTLSPSPADAAWPNNQPPPLVISNDPLPPQLRDKIYNKPTRAPTIDANQIAGDAYFNGGSEITIVGRKVDELRGDMMDLRTKISTLSDRLADAQSKGQAGAADYYASVATISTQLQSGTTPGNPRLVQRLNEARSNLEMLAGNIALLNDLAIQISNAASSSAFLLESTRATYSLAGAIEEDHVRLAELEDEITNIAVLTERLQNNVNDDITRTVAYLTTERENLRTMALAVTTGDLFGKSLSNHPFSGAQLANFSSNAPAQAMQAATPADVGIMGIPPAPAPVYGGVPGGPRPLVKIRFDKQNVAYEQPMYMAVNEAMSRYPNARFELVAVHPAAGNPASVAIESTRARRNAEKVLRTLTQMGVNLAQVDLSYTPSNDATTNEVHLYVR